MNESSRHPRYKGYVFRVIIFFILAHNFYKILANKLRTQVKPMMYRKGVCVCVCVVCSIRLSRPQRPHMNGAWSWSKLPFYRKLYPIEIKIVLHRICYWGFYNQKVFVIYCYVFYRHDQYNIKDIVQKEGCSSSHLAAIWDFVFKSSS